MSATTRDSRRWRGRSTVESVRIIGDDASETVLRLHPPRSAALVRAPTG